MTHKKQLKGFTRRNFLGVVGSGTLLAGLGTKLISPSTAVAEAVLTISPDKALQQLVEGNQRHVAHKLVHPDQTEQRLQDVAKGQHPFAIILGCADSRVPPEIVFDQGLGDLFVIRVAGNILDDAVTGSIEFAAANLGAPLVMVLGHEKCGAVTAALKGEAVPGHISSLVEAIKPAVEQVKGKPGDLLDNAVRANVKIVVEELKSSRPILADLFKDNKLKIVGGRYDLESGKVDIIA